VQGHLLIAYLAHQKYRLSRLFPQGQQQLIAIHGFFQGRPHLVFHAKKPVRWNHPIDALVGPEVVVMGDEMPKPLLGLRQFLGLNPLPEFLPDRGPKAFRFAHGLGMVGTGYYMLDSFPNQELLEIPLAPPGEVLAALVG
jgi:hypothetical protein